MRDVFTQIGDLLLELKQYFLSVWDGLCPIIGAGLGALGSFMFPTNSYWVSAKALGISMLVDIITRYISLAAQHGGLWKAFKREAIISKKLWIGSAVKLFVYFTIGILIGASYYIYQGLSPTVPVFNKFVEQGIPFLGTITYTIFFVREVQSSLENLNEFLIIKKYDDIVDIGWLMEWLSITETDIRKTLFTKIRENLIHGDGEGLAGKSNTEPKTDIENDKGEPKGGE